ncbi:hypothetical protein [Alicyclobacillus fructus]|uniref:hypothetical protein n=1 Tax=Alicyclobacillus fructus TaxID=2816082 RepID=UPI001A8C3290|nr:hypothetical protein [Alicyclobacillus fructus]
MIVNFIEAAVFIAALCALQWKEWKQANRPTKIAMATMMTMAAGAWIASNVFPDAHTSFSWLPKPFHAR